MVDYYSDIKLLKAKSGEGEQSSLLHHLMMVALCVEKFCDYLKIPEKIKTICIIAGFLHDIGKAHPDFQEKIRTFQLNSLNMSHRHEISSILFLPLFPRSYWPIIIEMVIAHHKSVGGGGLKGKGIVDLCEYEHPDKVFARHSENWDMWMPAAVEVLYELGVIKEKKMITIEQAREAFDSALKFSQDKKKQLGWSIYRGIMNGADYFASSMLRNTKQYLDNTFQIPDLSYYHKRIDNPIYPFSMKKFDGKKRHTLVIGTPGSGKTDLYFRRCTKRVVYLLPYQASINAMYQNVLKAVGKDQDVRLVHGSSRLVKDGDGIELTSAEMSLQRQIGASIKIMTPHQLASILVGTIGYEALILDIRGNDIIIDEIHCFEGLTLLMLLDLVNILANIFGCNVHIGSGTIPAKLKKKLIQILGKKNVEIVELTSEEMRTFDRHIIHKIKREDVADILLRHIKAKDRILFPVNNIGNSQATHEWIVKKLNEWGLDIPILIIHGRYKTKDRQRLEERIFKEFDAKSGPSIVIATQVLEVSLDISLDVMITECPPADDLFQRAARINRRRSLSFIKMKAEDRAKPVYVIEPPDSAKDCLPYNMDLLHRTFALLPDGKLMRTEDIQKIIDEIYADLSFDAVLPYKIWKIKKDRVHKTTKFPVLHHNKGSVVYELYGIDTLSCIIESDKEAYLSEKRTRDLKQYEFLLPWYVIQSKMRSGEIYQLKDANHRPYVFPDHYYDEILGVVLKTEHDLWETRNPEEYEQVS